MHVLNINRKKRTSPAHTYSQLQFTDCSLTAVLADARVQLLSLLSVFWDERGATLDFAILKSCNGNKGVP